MSGDVLGHQDCGGLAAGGQGPGTANHPTTLRAALAPAENDPAPKVGSAQFEKPCSSLTSHALWLLAQGP